jgi:hypothetical protein
MRANYNEGCEEYCPKYDYCVKRIHAAERIEDQAYAAEALVDEGEFVCKGPVRPLSGEGPFCRAQVTRLPWIRDAALSSDVESMLGLLALDTFTDADDAE